MSLHILGHHVHFPATLAKPPADRPRNSHHYPKLAQLKGRSRKSDRVTSEDLYWGRRAVAASDLPHPTSSTSPAPRSTLLSVSEEPIPTAESSIAKTPSRSHFLGPLLDMVINVVIPAPFVDYNAYSEKKPQRPSLSLVSLLPKPASSCDSRASSRSTSSGTSLPTTPTSMSSSTASSGHGSSLFV